MTRCVEREWLDELPATDLRAMQSRRDLRRLNAVMGHARFVANALRAYPNWSGNIIDLGGGDGRFLLKVARTLGAGQRHVAALLIDRLDLVEKQTVQELEKLGWSLAVRIDDVFEVLTEIPKQPGGAIMSNLFLHHFDDVQLGRLLQLQCARAELVIACEPRRSAMALFASRLVGLLGCNAVTRHDAVASVRAGFTNSDLTALCPETSEGSVQEGSFGLFSHGFICRRNAS